MALKEVVKLGEFMEQSKSGKIINFQVQPAPLEMEDEVVEFMTNWFLPREPMCKYRILGDPVSTKTLQGLWREAIRGGTSIIALKIDDDGQLKLIGANMTPITQNTPASSDKNYEGDNFNEVLEALQDIAIHSNIFEKYGVDSYMTGYGLTVDPEYSGFNVGLRILESRKPLCEMLGIKATGTVFTASSSQHIAKKGGFETLYGCDYNRYTVNGKKPFENIPGGFLMMGLKY